MSRNLLFCHDHNFSKDSAEQIVYINIKGNKFSNTWIASYYHQCPVHRKEDCGEDWTENLNAKRTAGIKQNHPIFILKIFYGIFTLWSIK